MKVIQNPNRDTWDVLIQRPEIPRQALEQEVTGIIKMVRELGDQALFNYTERFDRAQLTSLSVKVPNTIRGVAAELKRAIVTAHNNIKTYHESQFEHTRKITIMPGVSCWRKSLPIEKVGLYVPGGSAPLFSSLLMLGVPARLAGCKEIVVCTPPNKNGSVHPAMLYTARLLGLDRLYAVGGSQAIAAMAYGTESIPPVYKILGPGNQYVTMAKQLVSLDVAIDFPAGPSEVAVLADQQANPEFIAADLLSQAEHGVDSQVVLATNDANLLIQVSDALDRQLSDLPRREVAAEALRNSKMLLFSTLEEAMSFINSYAPEHLILNVKEPQYWSDQVLNAGSVFLGAYTPESAGDYASGTNHTLPTNGNARMYAGVSLDSYIKKITFQQITKAGLESIGPAVEVMACAEGLEGHRRSVTIRRNKS